MNSSRKKRPRFPWNPAEKSVTKDVLKCAECGKAPMHVGYDEKDGHDVLYCGHCGYKETVN